MSGASSSTVVRMTLIVLIFLLSCTFIASVVWILRTRASARQHDNYYLPRINISAKTDNNMSTSPPQDDHNKNLIKLEIAMRRVEENSRRLKEYTKSLLWNNKDKSLWCVLFKDEERIDEKWWRGRIRYPIDEDYIRALREQKIQEPVIRFRHHGAHHRRRSDVMPFVPLMKLNAF